MAPLSRHPSLRLRLASEEQSPRQALLRLILRETPSLSPAPGRRPAATPLAPDPQPRPRLCPTRLDLRSRRRPRPARHWCFSPLSTCLSATLGAVAPAFRSHCPHSAKAPTPSLHLRCPVPSSALCRSRVQPMTRVLPAGRGAHALPVFTSGQGTTVPPAARARSPAPPFPPPC